MYSNAMPSLLAITHRVLPANLCCYQLLLQFCLLCRGLLQLASEIIQFPLPLHSQYHRSWPTIHHPEHTNTVQGFTGKGPEVIGGAYSVTVHQSIINQTLENVLYRLHC